MAALVFLFLNLGFQIAIVLVSVAIIADQIWLVFLGGGPGAVARS